MIKVKGTEIENVKFNGVELDKVIVNSITVFEKMSPQENIVTMKTLQDNIRLFVGTKDGSPCEVWNAGNKIGVLNNGPETSISIPNKNEAVIIKGKAITSIDCSENQLTSLNVHGLNSLQYLSCYNNQLTSLNVQGLNNLHDLYCSENQLTSLNVQGLNNLQYLYCFSNNLTAQNFKNIFNSLLQTENGKAVIYYDNDNNYKDFTRPPELLEAFNGAKARGWKFYKNYKDDSNLL